MVHDRSRSCCGRLVAVPLHESEAVFPAVGSSATATIRNGYSISTAAAVANVAETAADAVYTEPKCSSRADGRLAVIFFVARGHGSR